MKIIAPLALWPTSSSRPGGTLEPGKAADRTSAATPAPMASPAGPARSIPEGAGEKRQHHLLDAGEDIDAETLRKTVRGHVEETKLVALSADRISSWPRSRAVAPPRPPPLRPVEDGAAASSGKMAVNSLSLAARYSATVAW